MGTGAHKTRDATGPAGTPPPTHDARRRNNITREPNARAHRERERERASERPRRLAGVRKNTPRWRRVCNSGSRTGAQENSGPEPAAAGSAPVNWVRLLLTRDVFDKVGDNFSSRGVYAPTVCRRFFVRLPTSAVSRSRTRSTKPPGQTFFFFHREFFMRFRCSGVPPSTPWVFFFPPFVYLLQPDDHNNKIQIPGHLVVT